MQAASGASQPEVHVAPRNFRLSSNFNFTVTAIGPPGFEAIELLAQPVHAESVPESVRSFTKYALVERLPVIVALHEAADHAGAGAGAGTGAGAGAGATTVTGGGGGGSDVGAGGGSDVVTGAATLDAAGAADAEAPGFS